jgi:hypothetical protein
MAMQGIMTESAHKQIDSMGEIQFTMFVTVLAQQLTMNALASGDKASRDLLLGKQSSEPKCFENSLENSLITQLGSDVE